MATKPNDYKAVIDNVQHARVMMCEYETPMRLVAANHPRVPHLRVLNISAAGNSLKVHPSSPLRLLPCESVDYVEGEIDTAFAASFAKPLLGRSSFPYADGSFDVVFSIAGMHHFSQEYRADVYRECRRVLRKGGLLVIGDVKCGSPQAEFLNGFVDTHAPGGHKGLFFEHGGEDEAALRSLFEGVNHSDEHYPWKFDSPLHRTLFCHKLFRLRCGIKQTADELQRVFGVDESDTSLPWMLTYFVAVA
jgi:SAM-dependent methyltransferase